MDSISTVASSPVPSNRRKGFCTFFEALQALTNNRRITRMAWQDANVYGFLDDKRVRIMLYNEQEDTYKPHIWEIAYEDLIAEDWMVLD